MTLADLHARERRQSEREDKEAEREARRKERKQDTREREEAKHFSSQLRATAVAKSEGIGKRVDGLKNLHRRFVNNSVPLDFDAILKTLRPTEFVADEVDHLCALPAKYYNGERTSHPEDAQIFDSNNVEEYLRYVRIQPPSLWERLTGSTRSQDELAQARELYERRQREVRSEKERAWARRNEDLRRQHAAHEAEKKEERQFLKKVRDGYAEADKWATARYIERKLYSVSVPNQCKIDYHAFYHPKDKRATVLVWMPDVTVVPVTTAVRYVAAHDEFRETKRSPGDTWRTYQAAAASLLVGVVHCTFCSDGAGHVDSVNVRVSMPGHDPLTGESARVGLVSLKVGRDEWMRLDPANVSPIECLRGIRAAFEEGWNRK